MWCRRPDRSWYPSAMSGHRYQSGFSAATPDDGLWLGCACRRMEAWRRMHVGETLSSFSPSTSPLSRYQTDLLLLLLFLLLETILHMAGRHTRTYSRGIRAIHDRISLFMATRTTPTHRRGIQTVHHKIGLFIYFYLPAGLILPWCSHRDLMRSMTYDAKVSQRW